MAISVSCATTIATLTTTATTTKTSSSSSSSSSSLPAFWAELGGNQLVTLHFERVSHSSQLNSTRLYSTRLASCCLLCCVAALATLAYYLVPPGRTSEIRFRFPAAEWVSAESTKYKATSTEPSQAELREFQPNAVTRLHQLWRARAAIVAALCCRVWRVVKIWYPWVHRQRRSKEGASNGSNSNKNNNLMLPGLLIKRE